MAVLLGLGAALGFGAADFLGGRASRRSDTAGVTVVVQAVGLVLAAGLVRVDDTGLPNNTDLALMAIGGLAGMTALGLFYQGLSIGRMSVVAPVTAVIGAVIPITWGLGRGERPSGLALAGIVIAVVAVALVAREPETLEAIERTTRPLLYAVAAGVGFGVVVVIFSEIADGTGMWPFLVMRVSAVTILGGALLATHRLVLPVREDRGSAAVAGVFDLSGNLAIIQGFREGLTSLVAPVASLYPAVTVLLARVALQERLARHQFVGLAGALLGLALIGAG